MNLCKCCAIAIVANIPFGYTGTSSAQERPETNRTLTVSAAAMERIAIALDMPTGMATGRSTEHMTPNEKPSHRPAPTAAIAFGITLLAAPVSMGGLFSR